MARAAGRSVKTAPEPKFLCHYCNKEKKKSEFYMSTDTRVLTGITRCCKDCARKIACNYNPYTDVYGAATKDTVIDALEVLDKPFFQSLFDASYTEWADNTSQKQKTSVWDTYIKNVSMPNYRGLRFKDGDIFEKFVEDARKLVGIKDEDVPKEIHDIENEAEINRKDLIRMLGYDPFLNYPVQSDKPLLYAQLVGFIDDETKNDMMKMNAIIQIVKSFNQIQKINDSIDELSVNTQKLNSNNGTIKQLTETLSKLISSANALAKDNGISVNHNNNKSKGQNTLTGKIKELEQIGFRDAKINMYDIDYCKGMQQVAEISAKAQVDQIGFDENVLTEISNIRRELIDKLQSQCDKANERARKLLVENKDLKDFLREKNLIDEFGSVIEYE
jgi:hypothetical protein